MKELEELLGDRISYEDSERRLCIHDVGNLPDVIGISVMDMLVERMPDAVLQPETTEEVAAILKYATKEGIPVTPRAAATSGVMGAVPAKGGIVVEFYRMNRILEVDEVNKKVRVQPGVVWAPLEEELNKHGLQLRAYPTSFPSSMVAGWIGSGGIGIGSFEYGSVGENIESLELVLPTGEVRTMTGAELDMVVDCQGITGIVTEVTLPVNTFEEVVPAGIQFESFEDLSKALLEVAKTVPIWTCNYEDKRFVELQNRATGHEGVAKDSLIMGIPKSRFKQEDIDRIAKDFNGTVHPDPDELWEERFMPMRVKKLGPSIIAGEVYIPNNRLNAFLEHVHKKFEGDTYGIEGTLGNDGNNACRVYVLSDERDDFGLGFTTRWGRALTFLAISKKYGGKTYQTGLYLAKESENYFGSDRLQRLFKFKGEVDPSNIMNPGKIKAPFKFSMIWGIATPFLDMSRGLDLGESDPKEPIKQESMLMDWNDHVYTCIECGTCRETCPVFTEERWLSSSPKGKMTFTKDFLSGKRDVDPYMYNRYFQCTLCGKCKEVCQAEIPVCDIFEHIRMRLHDMGWDRLEAHDMLLESILANGNPFGDPREKRTELYPDKTTGFIGPEDSGKVDVLIFAGCVNSYQDLALMKGLMGILDAVGKTYTTMGTEEGCCGYVALISGLSEFDDIGRATADRLTKTGASVVVTPCAGCYKTLAHHYEEHGIEHGLEVLHLVEYLDQLIKEGSVEFKKPFAKKVVYHDPCDIGRHLGIYEPPREVLKAVPELDLVEFPTNRNMATCCGGGGALKMVDLDLSKDIAYKRILEAISVGAEVVTSGCPACKANLKLAADRARKEKKGKLRVMDITEIVGRSLNG
jgi:Fe-S oxidoreductase/FAD/FMN-containing dehydrogenase